MNVTVHIEQLILDGVDISAGERPLLKTAVAAELSRLLQNDGLTHTENMTQPSVSTVPIQVKANTSGGQLGTQIGQAVYGGIQP